MTTATTPDVTADVTRDGDTVAARFTLKGLPQLTLPTVRLEEVRKPAFAFAGLADLALAQVKEAPAAYSAGVERAGELYAALAVRGERLVTSIRRQPATEAAIAEGQEAVAKAEEAVAAVTASVEQGVERAAGKADASRVAAGKSARAGSKAAKAAAEKLG